MKLIVKEAQNILDILATLSPQSSKTTLRSWIKERRVYNDDRLVEQSNEVIPKGATIEVRAKEKRTEEGVKIIFEDSHFVVVDKPAGLLSVASNFEKGDTVHAYLKKKYRPKKVFVVHRLDQETSGVMLFALSEAGYKGLKKLFEKHDIQRAYTACVEGCPEQDKGTWSSYLWEDAAYKMHSSQDPEKGEYAVTHYKVVNKGSKFSRLELTLETGKKNQIRVHCKEALVPIVGDAKYGSKNTILKRLGLHAHLLAFDHPVTKKKMVFSSPPPKVFGKIA